MADDVDEENRHRRIEYDLENGIDGHQDCAVVVVTASQLGPDQDL